MAWVCDTCVILDIACDDEAFARKSARTLQHRQSAGLVLCPVSYVELSPSFFGDSSLLQSFLKQAGISWLESWTHTDSETAAAAHTRYITLKRRGRAPKRPVADILIGAFACRFDGLITRNPDDFRACFPDLRMICP